MSISGIGEVDSAAPSHAMWAMSRMEPDSDEFRAAFDEFLYEFGSRGPNEWDIRSEVWETNPALVTVLIDILAFGLIIPVLVWLSLTTHHVEEEE